MTSSHRAAWRRQRLDQRVEFGLVAHARRARGKGDVIVDAQGQPDRQRRHHADLAAQLVDVRDLRDVLAIDLDLRPCTLASGAKSMVRLRQRSREVLPDWAGPMTPRISLRVDIEGDAVDDFFAP